MHGSSKASFPEILPRCVIPWENWSDNLRSVLRRYLRRYLVDYLFAKFAKWEGFEVRTKGTTSASLAPHTVDYLFLGIDAIICSPLINDLFVHPSLPWLSGRFTDCFLALSCPLGSKTKGTTFGNHRAGSYTIRPLFIWCERKCITFERR